MRLKPGENEKQRVLTQALYRWGPVRTWVSSAQRTVESWRSSPMRMLQRWSALDMIDAIGTNFMLEDRSLSVETSIYYDLSVPERGPSPLLVALHGYGANKRQMMREAKLMAPDGFAIASLQGFHQHLKEPKEEGGPLRYGFGWLTNFKPEESVALHHRAIIDLINALVDDAIADRGRIFLLGFSQSCALNYRFAFTHPDYLRGVIGICGGLPGDWDSSALYKQTNASVLHLTGNNDEFYSPSRTKDYASQLRMRSPGVEIRTYDAGHEIVQAMRDDVREWLNTRAAS